MIQAVALNFRRNGKESTFGALQSPATQKDTSTFSFQAQATVKTEQRLRE